MMTHPRRNQRFLWAGFTAIAVMASTGTVAQSYPTRPVRMVLGYPPGGGIDVSARILAPRLSELWGQQVVVDNRPGASGNIGAEIVARAAPDGYTLLMMTLSHAAGANLNKSLPFHAADSFSGVSLTGATTLVLLAHPSLPAKTLKDLIALAKAKPGLFSYGSSGIGGSPHLAAELLKLQAGMDMVHTPYKGTGQALTDLMGGHVPLLMAALPGAAPHIRSGRVRALGVTSSQRAKATPDIPTIAEAGVPGYDVKHWFGALAPTGTDRKVLDQLYNGFVTVMRQPDVIAALEKAGTDNTTQKPAEFDAYLRSEIARWGKVIKQAGITQ